jgi:hypothetical protein
MIFLSKSIDSLTFLNGDLYGNQFNATILPAYSGPCGVLVVVEVFSLAMEGEL